MYSLLKIKNYSSLHLSFRHLLKDLGQLFHLLCPQASLDDASCGHVQDLKGITLVTHGASLDILFHCDHCSWE